MTFDPEEDFEVAAEERPPFLAELVMLGYAIVRDVLVDVVRFVRRALADEN